MMKWTPMVVCAALAGSPAALAQNRNRPTPAAPAPGSGVVWLGANALRWMPAPQVLPKGAQVAVLFGDPFKPGLFAVRLKVPDGYRIPPHWHTQDEHLTILAGTLVLRMGDSMQARPHELTAGGFHSLPGGMHHSAVAHGETIIQLDGWGPFDIHYVNPADNPAGSAQISQRQRTPRR